jgi:hypothetical protein
MKIFRIAMLGCLAATAIWAADVSGKWTAEMQGRNGTTTTTMNFKVDGSTLTGTISNQAGDNEIADGKIDGNNISFTVSRTMNGNTFKQNYKGVLDGDVIHFTLTTDMGGMGGGGGQGGGNGGGGGGGGMGGRGGPRTFDAKRAS